MKTSNIRYWLLLVVYVIISRCYAQEEYYERPYPIVGDTITDYTFTDIVNFENNRVSISTFRGKWLILDYWAESCSACLRSFPKMNSLHEQFKDSVQFIMVGVHHGNPDDKQTFGSEVRTKGIYNVLNKMHSLSIPVAFDSVLAKKHDIGSLPHLLVIDPDGVLRAKTVSIDSTQMVKLIKGRPVDFQIALSLSEAEEARLYFNDDLPLLTTGGLANGGVDTTLYFRSILAPFNKKNMPYRTNLYFDSKRSKKLADKDIENGRIELRGVSIDALYRAAFFGRNTWSIHDPQHQKYSYKIKKITNREEYFQGIDSQYYAYSLIVPKSKSNREYLLRCMQSDLERYFGYKAEIKKIWIPVIYLKVRDKKLINKIRNRTGTSTYKNSEVIWQGFNETNITMKSFMNFVNKCVHEAYDLPVYDDTNINFNLDISINTNLLDTQNGIRELERLGFKLVKGRKKLETIVLR